MTSTAVRFRCGHRRSRLRLAIATAAALWCSGGGESAGQPNQVAVDNVWAPVTERPAALAPRTNSAGPSALVRLNKPAFDALMTRAPQERDLASSNAVVLSLPLADGSFGRFRVADSPILSPEVAAAFPTFRTYTGQGLDDPTATTRFGWTDTGFHAIVLSASGTSYIDPYAAGDVDFYAAVNKPDVPRPDIPFVCLLPGGDVEAERALNAFPMTNGASLRTYRLALAATGEYTAAAGGTKALALSRMVATINRVDGIYERELAVRFTLATGTAADSTALIYTDGSTDPYTNRSGSAMIDENQANLDAVVGTANYDLGHVFGTGGGGIASIASACSASRKAKGVSGLPNPIGDAFDVDFVAHEMGHQFGGNHTFNGTSANCGGFNRSGAHASEVGSGSTIQAYAGICSVENLQRNSDDYFTFESLNEMTAFLTSGIGASCGTASSTGNTAPAVDAGASYTIPIGTPFALTASGSDADGDTLTYDWEQWSLNGAPSSSVATASTDDGTRPLVRSYPPTTSPSRTFPTLTYILNNANVPPPTYACASSTCLTGEVLPATSRAITFQVTARDNRAGGGGIASASMVVTSSTLAGPFVVTSPNMAMSVAGGSALTVTWDVASTTAPPVSTANVMISLSLDGGATFPRVLSDSTPNDGSHVVTVPNTRTSLARIRVEAVGNIFFDVSNSNFAITAFQFTDHPLIAGTAVKAIHFTELRQAIGSLRTQRGLGAFAWTDATIVAGVTPVKAIHLNELRTALNEVYAAAGRTAPTYTHATATATATVITAVDIAELRAATEAIAAFPITG